MKLNCGAVVTRIPHIILTDDQKGYWETWIRALESGKFEQAKWTLRQGNAFCCLGVACHVIDPKGWTLDIGSTAYSFRPSNAQLNVEPVKDHLIPWIRKFYGNEVGPLGFHVGGRFPDGKGNTVDMNAYALAGVNDSLGASFQEIAEILRLAMAGGYTYSPVLVQ